MKVKSEVGLKNTLSRKKKKKQKKKGHGKFNEGVFNPESKKLIADFSDKCLFSVGYLLILMALFGL